MQVADTSRPPYVEFKTIARENVSESIKQGHFVADNLDIAVIMRPGNKDKLERVAREWLDDIKKKARSGEIPPEWSQHFELMYKNWKEGEAMPLHGTPIKGWAILSPAQQEIVIRAGVFTVEDLAQIPDNELATLGPVGGLDMRTKARAWLEASTNTGKVAAENAALKVRVADQETQIKTLMEGMLELKAQVAALKPAESKK